MNCSSAQRVPLDSHQKFANDVFAGNDEAFRHVNPADRDEVRCLFARLVAEAGRPANVRVMPLHMTEKFRATESGGFYSTQIRATGSGRVYLAGFTPS